MKVGDEVYLKLKVDELRENDRGEYVKLIYENDYDIDLIVVPRKAVVKCEQ